MNGEDTSNLTSPKQEYEGMLPVSLKTIEPELPEPIRSIYKAQLGVIQALEKPDMIEAQTDLVLAHLDHAVSIAPEESKNQIVKMGALTISHLLFLSNAFIVFQENGNQDQLMGAIEEFVGKMANDICMSVAVAGKTLQPSVIGAAVLGAVIKRVERDGGKFFSKMLRSLFGKLKAKRARREYLSLVSRVLGKAARRPYFYGNGQHLVDFLKRYEADILAQDVKKQILSSGQELMVWISVILMPAIVVFGAVWISGIGDSIWGHIWRIAFWCGSLLVAGGIASEWLRPWLIKLLSERRIKRIYRHLEGQKVSLGPG